MKLLTIDKQGKHSLGVMIGEWVADIREALNVLPVAANANVPTEITALIEAGPKAYAALAAYVERIGEYRGDSRSFLLAEHSVTYGPCVTRPGKIVCVGLNYRKHAEETGLPIPAYPILFNKFANSLSAHRQDVAYPKVTQKLDYEAELAIVIGDRAKYVSKKEALNHVFGYCIANDLSARDLQMRTPQWMLGKCCDGFSPVGPWLVTADEVGNPNALAIKTWVNGDVRQLSDTSDMIFYCDEIVSYVSQYMTLMPGDLILTGTPEGVVLGYPPEKQAYMQPGDEVTIEIEKLGVLTNRIVPEQSSGAMSGT